MHSIIYLAVEAVGLIYAQYGFDDIESNTVFISYVSSEGRAVRAKFSTQLHDRLLRCDRHVPTPAARSRQDRA
jgi:hypothetical protein